MKVAAHVWIHLGKGHCHLTLSLLLSVSLNCWSHWDTLQHKALILDTRM